LKYIYAAVLGVWLANGAMVAADEKATARAGDIIEWAIPISALVATFPLNDKDGRKQFLIGFGVTMLTTYTLKEITNKKRPDNNDHDAFPSAHSAVSFHGAAFLHERYGLKVGIPAYLAAGFVGYSRVDVDRHDYQDVLAGALLGIVISRYFTKKLPGIEVAPLVEPGTYGVQFAARW
jgi:membrane-associated phospholipid phosphatase